MPQVHMRLERHARAIMDNVGEIAFAARRLPRSPERDYIIGACRLIAQADVELEDVALDILHAEQVLRIGRAKAPNQPLRRRMERVQRHRAEQDRTPAAAQDNRSSPAA